LKSDNISQKSEIDEVVTGSDIVLTCPNCGAKFYPQTEQEKMEFQMVKMMKDRGTVIAGKGMKCGKCGKSSSALDFIR
jgi:uncharacterized protein with PIN domain